MPPPVDPADPAHEDPDHDSQDQATHQSNNVLALAQRSLASASQGMLAFVGPDIDNHAALLAASDALAAASACFRAAAHVIATAPSQPPPRRLSRELSASRSARPTPARHLPVSLARQRRPLEQQSGLPLPRSAYPAAIDSAGGPNTDDDDDDHDDHDDGNDPHAAESEPSRRAREDYLGLILPHEIKEMIYEHFDLDAWKTIRVVCRSWNEIATPHLFGQVYLHRCESRRNDFKVFMRLCTRPLRYHIRCVRLCSGHCGSNLELQAPTDIRSNRVGPAPRPDVPRRELQVEDEENLESDYLAFIRQVDTMHIKSRFVKDKPSQLSREMSSLFFGSLVGLASLTISHSDLFDLLGHDSAKTDGLLSHVLFPRLRSLRLESTTCRLVHLWGLLEPHASTLRDLHFDRVYLESHDWRTFFRDLGARQGGRFRLDAFAMRIGRTKLFQDGQSWRPLVTQALGVGNITPSQSEPPRRIYVDGFEWKRRSE